MHPHHYFREDFMRYLVTEKKHPETKLFDRHVRSCARCRKRMDVFLEVTRKKVGEPV